MKMPILVVDDDQDVLEIITELLIGAGFATIPARDGNEALAVIVSGRPINLLLTDVRMPMIDGFALAETARRHIPDLPIIYLSGWVEELPPPGKIAFGPLLLKPVQTETLCRAVRQHAKMRSE
jgi:two-component system cell cycle sensor histidine kinase/response regulator CckA